jgi:transglutaminase-like putative cysteine protease
MHPIAQIQMELPASVSQGAIMKPYHYARVCAVFIFFLAIASPANAQDPPIQWGEIPKADLEMKTFPQDTNASALILCDYGESFLDNELYIVFQRHERVKIFTTKGYEWGTYKIPLYTEDHEEKIKNIEGATYSLNDHGEVVKKELNSDDVIEEKGDGKHTIVKFTLPGLTPGCVIEVRYTITARNLWFIRDWRFQHSEPVRWSEYRIRSPKSIAFATVSSGYEPFAIAETKEVTQTFSGLRHLLGDDNVACNQTRWAVKDLPALRDEPFVTTMDDYYDKVDAQLYGWAFVSTGLKKFMDTWNTMVNELAVNDNFLQRVDDTRRVRKQAEEITAGLPSPGEKMRAIYAWVRKSVVWNGQDRKYSDKDVDDVLESKKGSSADITFLLLSLLKSAGIEADPVILSTRDHGIIQDLYPMESQFNYVLARVSIPPHYYYLDATDPLRPMELLPANVLNVRGLVIKKDSLEWITFSSSMRSLDTSQAMITLRPDGSLTGVLQDTYREYANLIARKSLRDKKDVDFAKETFETEEAGITVDSATVEGKDSIDMPLKLKAWISSPTYAQCNGDLMYINPHILHRTKENPFKSKTRKFPVDYSYQRSYTSTVTLTLPDSFAVKALPRDRSLYVGSSLLSYTQRVQADSHQVRIVTKMDVRETEIKPKHYEELRYLYSQRVGIDADQLVLERIKAPAPAVQNVNAESKHPRKKGKK